MAFYDLKGNRLSLTDFIEIYSQKYFMCSSCCLYCNKSSRYVEKEIEKILYGHIEKQEDVFKIMAWKMGKIKHRESEINSRFVYYSDWNVDKDQNPKRYKETIDIRKFSKYIIESYKDLEELAKSNPQECLNKLEKNSVSGIGTVYLITMLFFLSHGEYPIYDRFAMAALTANSQDIKPSTEQVVIVKDLPDKKNTGFKELIGEKNSQYKKYIEALEELKKCGIDYKNNRKVDQALWVYGHTFTVQSCKSHRKEGNLCITS